ncbi:MAG TPA: acyl-CoA-binding protein [Edaphocola sp.]|nr:acyl-CoA-binding protein [Edaphocola sp.]
MNFDEAVIKSKTITQKPSNEILLSLYSLYKQVMNGDAPEEESYNMFDFVSKAKHEAWLKLKGMSTEKAKEDYINLVESLLDKGLTKKEEK